jgi:hypothetical protein
VSFEVEQRAEHCFLVGRLFLIDRALSSGDHMHGPAELNYPVGPHLVALHGSLVHRETFLLIAQCPSVVAVSSPE